MSYGSDDDTEKMRLFLGVDEIIGVRAGGRRAAATPRKFWATQIFWAARENLGKASF